MISQNGGWDGGWGEGGNRNKLLLVVIAKPVGPVQTSVAEPEPVLFGQSRCEGPSPGSGSTLYKTDEI